MSSVLGSALDVLLHGLRALGAPGASVKDWLGKLGYQEPPLGAAPHIDAIEKALPANFEIGTDAGIDELINHVTEFIRALKKEPVAMMGKALKYANLLSKTLPERVIGYVVITETQKRAPLVAGLLRMAGVFAITHVTAPPEFDPDLEVAGPRYLVDLAQLRLLLSDPKAGLRWGQTDFKAEAVVWGLEDIVDAIFGRPLKTEADRLSLAPADEHKLLKEQFPIPATPSPAAVVDVGPRKLRLAGLHEHGIVIVPATVNFTVGLPDAVKNCITDATGFKPEDGEKPGLLIAPDKIGSIPLAAAILPGD